MSLLDKTVFEESENVSKPAASVIKRPQGFFTSDKKKRLILGGIYFFKETLYNGLFYEDAEAPIVGRMSSVNEKIKSYWEQS